MELERVMSNTPHFHSRLKFSFLLYR